MCYSMCTVRLHITCGVVILNVLLHVSIVIWSRTVECTTP